MTWTTIVTASTRVALVIVLLLGPGCGSSATVRRADDLLRSGDYARAELEVDRALAATPEAEELLAMRVRILVARDRRAEAAGACGRVAGAEKRAQLLRALSEAVVSWGLGQRDPAVRLSAIHVARGADMAPLAETVAARLDDPDEVVRTWAAVALSGEPRGADVLERMLGAGKPEARAVAVRELGRLAGRAAVRTVASFAADRSPLVRAAAADGLGHVARPEALPTLERLAADPQAEVRQAALSALERIGDPRGVELARRALRDPYLGVRLAALLALVRIEGNRARPTLALVAAGADRLMALRAGVQLAKLGDPTPALALLGQGVRDALATVRLAALAAASTVDHPRVLELVATRLRDPDPEVRAAAARALLSRKGDAAAARNVARNLKGLACGRGATSADAFRAPGLCLQAAELLLRAEDNDGLQLLSDLARRARLGRDRLQALELALMRGAGPELALAGVADADPYVALASARWIYLRNR
ncbi:MAG: HEAT repeat domain-containing protein [Deltaproteobacteria bacterium]|nr:HEAT repeat domain-containing protein [Deltaproteobacteria bacterium]